MTTKWKLLHPQANPNMLGYLPAFLDEKDPRSAQEQLDANYPFGGFQPFEGHTMTPDGQLKYPGDPPMMAIAETKVHNEIVRLYQHSWVAVIQENGDFVVARMD